MIVIAIYLLYEAYLRILDPREIAALEMFGVALAGLAVNLVSAGVLTGAKGDDLNIKSAYLHMLGDTLSSVAVVAGAIVIFATGWTLLDPILSVVICAVIMFWAYGLLRDSAHILLESAPKHIKVDDVVAAIHRSAPTVKEVHDVHVWEITSRMYCMTAHVVVTDCRLSDCAGLMEAINKTLDKEFDIVHANLQFECKH